MLINKLQALFGFQQFFHCWKRTDVFFLFQDPIKVIFRPVTLGSEFPREENSQIFATQLHLAESTWTYKVLSDF